MIAGSLELKPCLPRSASCFGQARGGDEKQSCQERMSIAFTDCGYNRFVLLLAGAAGSLGAAGSVFRAGSAGLCRGPGQDGRRHATSIYFCS